MALDLGKVRRMAEYIPPALDWVREQVELYETAAEQKADTSRYGPSLYHSDPQRE